MDNTPAAVWVLLIMRLMGTNHLYTHTPVLHTHTHVHTLCVCIHQERRGVQQQLLYLTSSRVMLTYILPLSEVLYDFFDQVKSVSSGYARYDI